MKDQNENVGKFSESEWNTNIFFSIYALFCIILTPSKSFFKSFWAECLEEKRMWYPNLASPWHNSSPIHSIYTKKSTNSQLFLVMIENQ